MNAVMKNSLSLFLLACMFFTTAASVAQQTQASLAGQVLDPQGAAIPGADVTIANVDTAIARTTQSNTSGRYSMTNLNPGKYSVTVKAANFSEKVLSGIVLEVGQAGSLDVSLTLGSTSDVVNVSATAAVTDTESSSQGTVIDNQKVVGLPLNQRTFYGLALLSPAAYMPGQSSTLGFRGGFNVAGNNETANTFTINGIDDNDQNVMAPSFRPSVEGIQEFKLLTGVYPAEYGRTSGGQVVVITKTGTNAFHGDLFEFLRNSQFDAKNYFTVPGTATTFRRNQFGGTIGGPIIRDRTFFFLSYEGLRLAQPTVGNTFVPNPAMLNGDFSSITKQLVNPNPLGPQFTTVNGKPNQISTSALDTIALAILKTYPAPNPGYTATNAAPAYTLNVPRIENMDEGSARLDHKFTDKDSILVQYNYFNDPSFEPSLSLCSSALIPGYGCTQNQISTLAGINYIRIINDHWLNELRLGYDRLEQPRIGQDSSLTSFPKVPGAFNDPHIPANLLGGAPSTTVSGYASIHPYGNLPQHRWDNHYNIVDNVSWSHGNHNFKFGINFVQARYADLYVADATGVFTYTGVSNSSGSLTTGSAIADLALGYATTATRSPTAPNIQVHYTSYGGYAQDDWKVTPNLTLNLGLRYEYFSPVYDAKNVLSNFVLPSSANPAGTIAVAGFGGQSRTVYNGDGKNFGPRVGLAYQVFGNDRTVFHASYGLFYNSPAIGNGSLLNMGINPPFRLVQQFTSSAKAQSVLSSSPFPSTGSTPNGSAALPYQNVSPTGQDPNFKTLYLDEYGADIQQQLTPTIALTIGFIGNEGARIPRVIEPNQAVNAVPGYSSVVNGTTVITPIIPPGKSANTVISSNAITGTAGPIGPNALYYQWGNIAYYVSSGHSSFRAMTVKAQKSMGNGVSFILAYTWGHSIDNAPGYASSSAASSPTPQNSYNLQAERGTSDFNVQSRIALSPVIELPFGKNKQFLTHGIAAAIAGGWQLSGIYQYDSGRPFTISMSTRNSGSIYGTDRPNVVADPNSGPKTVTQWFNTSAFVANGYAQFGNERRNALIGPNYSDLDIAIQRSFLLTERYAVSIRAESFDVMNKPNFFNPLGTGTGQFGTTSFGQLTQANDPRSMQFSGKFTF